MVLAALSAAACGDSPSSPSGASSVTVNGSIVSFASGSAGSQSARTSSTTSVSVPVGMRVKVNGTNIDVDVQTDGTFTLKNVPSGNIIIQFTGPTTNATITLTDLETGQVVTLNVNVNGTTAEVESDRRSKGGEEQLEGRVESLPPTTLPGELVVSGRTVRTNANTIIRQGDATAAFAALQLGYRVHVKGETTAGVLLAREIKIQNTNTSTGLNINGDVSLFTGTRPAFQFNIGTRVIKGDANTEFFGNSEFADLANGKRVEVKGSQRDGFVYADRIKVNR
jgi:hypothetical protein